MPSRIARRSRSLTESAIAAKMSPPPVPDESRLSRESAPGVLSPGTEHARVLSGEFVTTDSEGHPTGSVHVGPGWFFTPRGYERLHLDTTLLETQIERAQSRAESCAQLAEATCAAAAAAHAGYSAPAVAACSVFSLLLGVALGWLGLLVRRSHPVHR